MPIGNADVPKALQTAMRMEFLKTLDNYPGSEGWRKFTMEVPSTTDTETYGWLSQLPQMREFLGERVIRELAESGFTLKNKTWEMTIGIKRTAWEDDKVGSIKQKVQTMAWAYREWQAEQAYKCLLYGDTTAASGNPYGNAYDDIAAYVTNRDLGGGAIDNLGTTALSADAVKTEIGVMKGYKGDQGKYLNVTPNLLVVAPKIEFTARELVTAAPGATSGQSLWGYLEVDAPPYWSADYDNNTQSWALVDTTKPIKPVVFQRRTELEFASLTIDSDTGFLRDEWLFGVRVRCAFGYGAPWLANLQQVP